MVDAPHRTFMLIYPVRCQGAPPVNCVFVGTERNDWTRCNSTFSKNTIYKHMVFEFVFASKSVAIASHATYRRAIELLHRAVDKHVPWISTCRG
ncbi:hypothetical protein HBI18_255190 [Parastagonospora nodorum]|nr:hypothetical protein HBH71_256800 [Parastagonospora nodorum]KAH5387053.1 hypothetical protein HBI32_257690 [Parastagonospora nodorum]KAH5703848.1 hypothetical protein HBI18_255190 [Parastagonospora nodorum]